MRTHRWVIKFYLLERSPVQQFGEFLLELGRGFMFVDLQKRVTINNTHYYVDMVFYNKILRAIVSSGA